MKKTNQLCARLLLALAVAGHTRQTCPFRLGHAHLQYHLPHTLVELHLDAAVGFSESFLPVRTILEPEDAELRTPTLHSAAAEEALHRLHTAENSKTSAPGPLQGPAIHSHKHHLIDKAQSREARRIRAAPALHLTGRRFHQGQKPNWRLLEGSMIGTGNHRILT